MVPAAPPADDHADPAWLARVRSILRLNRGGVVVGLEGAHAACAGPLIEVLLEGGAEVRVCSSAPELLEAPEGARVVLLHAARDAELLNMIRPVIAERRLRAFVWLRPGDRRELSRRARDFLDWMQESVDVPDFVPEYAMVALRHALEAGAELSWEGRPLRDIIPAATVVQPDVGEREAAAAMRQGPVVVFRAGDVDEINRLEAAHAAAGRPFGLIWEEPAVLPRGATRVIAEPLDWEVASSWLSVAGVDRPRIEAAKLHLDPMAVSQRAGREPPPLRASAQRSGAPAMADAVGTSTSAVRVAFPSRVVTLRADLDARGELEIRHEGRPLDLYGGRFGVVDEPASLPVTIEILDFYGLSDEWRVDAYTDTGVESRAWERETDRCHTDFGETHGRIRVEVVATSTRGTRRACYFDIEVVSTAPTPTL